MGPGVLLSNEMFTLVYYYACMGRVLLVPEMPQDMFFLSLYNVLDFFLTVLFLSAAIASCQNIAHGSLGLKFKFLKCCYPINYIYMTKLQYLASKVLPPLDYCL